MVHFDFFYDQLELVLEKMIESVAFEDELVAFMAYAGKGGPFALAVDSSDAAISNVRINAPSASTRIAVDSSTPFTIGNRYLIESGIDGWQREIFEVTAKDVVDPPSVDIDRNLIYGYLVGDTVRSIDYYPKCVVDQEEFPLDEVEARLRTFRLKVRTYYDIETA
jgi:hypothetical protein